VLLSISSSAQVSLLPDSVAHLLHKQPIDSAAVAQLNAIAFAYLKSDPLASRELADHTMKLADEIQFRQGFARAMNIKGSSYWVVGDYESALEYYQLCAKECTAINDERGLAEAYHNIGEVHKKLHDYRKAIRFLKISMEWDKKNNVNYAITLYNIGEAHFERDEYEEALLYFNEALNRSIAEKDVRTTAYSYNGLGKLERQNGNTAKALDYFRKAEVLWRNNGELRSLIQTYQDIAGTHLLLRELDQASAYAEMATALADSVRANDLQVDNFQLQSDIDYAAGAFRKSADWLRVRNELQDSLYDLNRSQQIARLQVAFASDAQVIENEQLKAARALQDAKLRAQSFMIVAISGGLLVVGLLAIVFFRQRKKIFLVNALIREKTSEVNKQKEEIEFQARALKNLNEALQNLNKSLESKIEERTHQLWWKNQKLADYAYTNSHKLRAPVASILGLIQLMERIDLPEEDKILLEKLIICARDLDKITHDINQNLEQDPELADAVHRTFTASR
jgi:tetratricopeptide (TPR) repeat protein